MKLSILICAASMALPAAGYAQGITDAQIASIVVTVNQVDIDAGKVAASRATNARVKAYGERMASDHAGVNKSAVELATRLGVVPQDNATSRSLEDAGEKNLASLNQLSGAAFDKAYIAHEVAYHTQVLEALDKTLIPNASNGELKALLVKVRPAFVAHLRAAEQIQSALVSSN